MDQVYRRATEIAFNLALFATVGLMIVHHNEEVKWRPILAKWLSFLATWIAWQAKNIGKGHGFRRELIARLAVALLSMVAAVLAMIDATSLPDAWDVAVHAISAAMLLFTFLLAVGLALILAIPSLRDRFSAEEDGLSYEGF
jgi:hypothetical protein